LVRYLNIIPTIAIPKKIYGIVPNNRLSNILIKDGQEEKELLLAMKKRGFGIGKWNGVGGKFDLEKGDKDVVDAARRETEEEIGVKVESMEKVAVLNFNFPIWIQFIICREKC